MYTNDDQPTLTLWWAGNGWATDESCETDEYTLEQVVALYRMGMIADRHVADAAVRHVAVDERLVTWTERADSDSRRERANT